MEKTLKDAEMRLNAINGMRPNLSNALAAEEDAIKYNGVKGWNEYLHKQAQRRLKNSNSRSR